MMLIHSICGSRDDDNHHNRLYPRAFTHTHEHRYTKYFGSVLWTFLVEYLTYSWISWFDFVSETV